MSRYETILQFSPRQPIGFPTIVNVPYFTVNVGIFGYQRLSVLLGHDSLQQPQLGGQHAPFLNINEHSCATPDRTQKGR